MSERKGKKRPKSYYIKCANKKPKKDVWKLEPGIKGFLVSCNSNERGAVRDAYNLLNEYADKLYGPEKVCFAVILIILLSLHNEVIYMY